MSARGNQKSTTFIGHGEAIFGSSFSEAKVHFGSLSQATPGGKLEGTFVGVLDVGRVGGSIAILLLLLLGARWPRGLSG